MIERQHLQIIQSIDRYGTLTEAAKALCLTQSALSHSIKKLESQLGDNIWLKEGRTLRLTQSGQYLLTLASRVLPQLESAEITLGQYAKGLQGALRIGMECHPCYQWLLRVIAPYLQQWPKVDVDVKRKFQFGGMRALFNYDIDLLVTPDPLHKNGVSFTPVFDYEHVLVVAHNNPLAQFDSVVANQLHDQTLITYPVEPQRLDIFCQFLTPACVAVAKHKTVEDTEVMLQLIESGRGVGALPRWLVEEYAKSMRIKAVALGHGMFKQIHIGVREGDLSIPYFRSFMDIAKQCSVDYKP